MVLCSGGTLLPEHLLLDAGPAAKPVGPAVAEAPPAAEAPRATEAPPIAEASPDGAPGAAGGGDLRSELDDLERRRILDALEQCAGNQTRAAALLGMPRRTFVARLGAYGIRRPRKKPR
ncbi:MAG TPA: helix-turn-helix domain-containing protein [Kofleriaceae bacterium]|nr:helix-turn-helix domain-containing protein [Kofleriaceae bacterium]